MSKVQLTQSTTTHVLIHNFFPSGNGLSRVHFTADFGDGERLYGAYFESKYEICPKDENGNREQNLTPKDGSGDLVLFKATITPVEGKWHFTSLVKVSTNKEYLVESEKKPGLLAKAMLNMKGGVR